ncbi:MAG: DNA-binding response regulator [Thalassobius sp.]|nr:DNA-binding response regulator [Thalassovita sp.]
MDTLTIALVEDDKEIREVIALYLRSCNEFKLVEEFNSVEDLMESVDKGQAFNVVLMDIQLPGKSGIEGIKILKERFEHIDIIMLTIYNDEYKIFDSLCAGATGYLLKNTPLVEVKSGILELHKGGSPMSPQIARKVVHFFNKVAPRKKNKVHLSDRETEIVDALVEGLSYKLIADKLFISVDTVRYHIKNIYRKLQVNSKAEVISKALKGEL